MYIVVPVRARFERDIAVREKLLEECASGRPVGFEVWLGGGPDGDLLFGAQIQKNLSRFLSRDDFFISVHVPLEEPNGFNGKTDLALSSGAETFCRVLRFARSLNARLVNAHIGHLVRGDVLLEKDVTQEERNSLHKVVLSNIQEAIRASEFAGTVAVENMPFPLMGDRQNMVSVQEMVYDPLLITVEDMKQFCGVPGIGVCLDTSHYGITRRVINDIVEHSYPAEELRSQGVLGLPPEARVLQPTLHDMERTLGSCLKHIHCSDYRGRWLPDRGPYSEGVPLGEGELGDELISFLVSQKEKDIAINLEVRDKDIQRPEETKRSIRCLLRFLEGA